MAANTLLINGVDVRAGTGVKVIGDMSSILYAPGTLRGPNDTIPRRRGQVAADLPLDSYLGAIQLQISGATRAAKETNLRTFLAAIRGNSLSALCTLERRIDNGAGYTAATADGQITGSAIQLLNSYTGRTTLEIVNLSGAWLTGATWIIP